MRYLLALVFAVLLTAAAQAQCPGGRCPRPTQAFHSPTPHKADTLRMKVRTAPRAVAVHVATKSQHRRAHRGWRPFARIRFYPGR